MLNKNKMLFAILVTNNATECSLSIHPALDCWIQILCYCNKSN